MFFPPFLSAYPSIAVSDRDAPSVPVTRLVDRYRQVERELSIPQTINGMVESFGTIIISTEQGQLYNLSGASAKPCRSHRIASWCSPRMEWAVLRL